MNDRMEQSRTTEFASLSEAELILLSARFFGPSGVPLSENQKAAVEEIVAARVAEAKADAWDEGFLDGQEGYGVNPYRRIQHEGELK